MRLTAHSGFSKYNHSVPLDPEEMIIKWQSDYYIKIEKIISNFIYCYLEINTHLKFSTYKFYLVNNLTIYTIFHW